MGACRVTEDDLYPSDPDVEALRPRRAVVARIDAKAQRRKGKETRTGFVAQGVKSRMGEFEYIQSRVHDCSSRLCVLAPLRLGVSREARIDRCRPIRQKTRSYCPSGLASNF